MDHTKVILAGDTHGSRKHIDYLIEKAKNNDCKLIISLGDFGYWPRHQWGIQFLKHCQSELRRDGLELWWLDGNHEDHDMINALYPNNHLSYITRGHGDDKYPNLKYLPRGYRFELGGVSFMSYGGAFSIDRPSRVKHQTWFPNEIISDVHIDGIEAIHTDILLSHDVPSGYDFNYDPRHWGLSIHEVMASQHNRDLLYTLVQKITPHYTYGGHHHNRKTWTIYHDGGHSESHVLDCNFNPDNSYVVLDLQEIKDRIK